MLARPRLSQYGTPPTRTAPRWYSPPTSGRHSPAASKPAPAARPDQQRCDRGFARTSAARRYMHEVPRSSVVPPACTTICRSRSRPLSRRPLGVGECRERRRQTPEGVFAGRRDNGPVVRPHSGRTQHTCAVWARYVYCVALPEAFRSIRDFRLGETAYSPYGGRSLNSRFAVDLLPNNLPKVLEPFYQMWADRQRASNDCRERCSIL
jgi:hypothetical protein